MKILLGLLTAAAAAAAAAVGDAQPPTTGRIVFSSDRGGDVDNTEIYAVGVDGRRRRGLSRNAGHDGGAVWSPDGSRIAYWSERRVGARVVRGLYVVRRDGSGRRRLTPRSLGVEEDTPTWSPDGSRIAFSTRSGLRTAVWTVRSDGTRFRFLTRGTAPAWSPNGDRVAVSGRPGIAIVPASRGRARRVTRDGHDGFHSWSPDGQTIVFLRNVERRQAQDLYTVPAAGGRPRLLFGGKRDVTIARPPRWSPDGRRILFGADRAGFFVYAVRVRDRALRRLGGGDWPAWSPDGRRIVFTRGSAIYVMRSDGTRARRLRSEGRSSFSEGPVWSPDGRLLMYATLRLQSDLEILTIGPAGSGLRRLTRNGVNDWMPAWSLDRRRIAFVRGRFVWLMSADGSRQRRLVAGSQPAWSPTGRELAISTARGVEITPIAGGSPRRLAAGGTPVWSPRGAEIAYLRGLRVLATNVASGAERMIADFGRSCPGEPELSSLDGLDWAPDGRRLVVVLSCDDGRFTSVSPVFVDADDGSLVDVRLDSLEPTRVAFSRDGRRLAFVSELDDLRLATARVDGTQRKALLRGVAGRVLDPDW